MGRLQAKAKRNPWGGGEEVLGRGVCRWGEGRLCSHPRRNSRLNEKSREVREQAAVVASPLCCVVLLVVFVCR